MKPVRLPLGVGYALAAALFGASTPFAKLLVGSVAPVLLAGLLYLGSGCGLMAWWLGTRRNGKKASEARYAGPTFTGAPGPSPRLQRPRSS